MGKYDAFYEARKTVSEILFKDFVGPVTKDEILTELPSSYYIMGKLYPQKETSVADDDCRSSFLENQLETYDASVSLSNEQKPASMGITCVLKDQVNGIRVTGSYAFYDPESLEQARETQPDLEPVDKSGKKDPIYWVRKEFPINKEFTFTDQSVYTEMLPGNLSLSVYTNRVFDDGKRVVTVVLLNNTEADHQDRVAFNRFIAFQPVLKISSIFGEESIFTSVDQKIHMTQDPELLELELLYRDNQCYAQGHGCSVTWKEAPDGPTTVETTFFPVYDLKLMKPGELKDLPDVLSMQWLYTAEKSDVISGLRKLTDNYSDWIKKQVTSFDSNDLSEAAARNIERCRNACSVIQKTVDALASENGEVGFRAFRLANEAMMNQRIHTLKKEGITADPKKISWYPFQLAFILQEMISFLDPTGEERKTADLLWFPTGGGKTEAYLGIAAFVMFYRRLMNSQDDGVTVIMRYTLRLLTTQQFERAATLICACELLRQREGIQGSPFSIGLWVGDGYVPNHIEKAYSSWHALNEGETDVKDNPCQLKVCPWCGSKLTYRNYHVDVANKRMTIRCSSSDCEFSSSGNTLPIHMVDDSIYQYLPTFLVATVDKFAQIPMSDKPAALFGISNGKNPPELIIQDELHLISGPLGTISGLYEAAIEKICEKNGICAKVVASTATIRNAESQIRGLFGRRFSQFPPQGIDVSDSFFAVESLPDDRPSRRYIGVMGVDTTATSTLIRINAALLFATRYLVLQDYPDTVKDNFWTITDYINSLRELGGASTQILDDVQSRFAFLAKTKFAEAYPGVDGTRQYVHNCELTSRMDSNQLTDAIQTELKVSYPRPDAIDYLLASNMISVGVDVGRLGVMTVAGQPKTNAEYIQSTSRVGRSNPGLVVTAYNAGRSRDRSHYEQFVRYHSGLYRYVEATSVTPFSDRAQERALNALFVGLCRYLVPGMLKDSDAVRFRKDRPEIQEIIRYILDYVRFVDASEVDSVRSMLDRLCDSWESQAQGELIYHKPFSEGKVKQLLVQDTKLELFSVMNSMRSVESQSGIYLLGRVSK